MTPLVSCAFCGRDNEPMSRFCIDCGKPLSASAARVAPGSVNPQTTAPASPFTAPTAPVVAAKATPCPKCAKPVGPDLPFCGHCGSRITQSVSDGNCRNCGADY